MARKKVNEVQLKKARKKIADTLPLSKYIESKRLGYVNGKSGSILCPVHDENTPSFRYDDEKKRCHCFGCGVKGTVVELNYQINKNEDERYTIIRSIRELAEEYDIKIPDLYTRDVPKKGEVSRASKRKRGTRGKENEWIYREKLISMEGDFWELPTKERVRISELMDDMWLGDKKASEVYWGIQDILDKKRVKGR